MRKKLGRAINKVINPLGYALNPVQQLVPRTSGPNWLKKLDIKTVIDIGSNKGQFLHEINQILPGSKYFAFEPIKSCYQQLVTNTSALDITTFNIGLGDKEHLTDINISGNFESSSLLQMESLHETSFPESRYVAKETIHVKTLDSVMRAYQLTPGILIKLDVQGYEKNVIEGGRETLQKADAIIIESVFEPFYEGQWLFDDLYNYFSQQGFKFMGFVQQFHSLATGIPIYADAIFIKKTLVNKIVD